ncbi:MAG: BamA/TamA family outer membrane protein [Gemmatimonadetes bacterium]|uniref:BamA/TamA family outer membrane protein n=1 Tax=Candidatus Kutchimonas denitrificans TaxID=3056748 RepID=A0AAE5CA43_9BACT|nr:BamA/TamA family outer membrane protein [Gemmatimonadota bacterium]NIR76126.1 BamA/TamA family outer membrane protein [Candidatus Kutchimonas denitrificans]NIS00505.1 BamA/TamA family outer membrane protein [Gemmatimonadota bacterium]NIT66163.1 BamA/TamA family outer membrane protein [Gemmatimonadota bacterium]NIU54241.1 BamA/TamA family outer membrane protein [Gemmatimonadota bacterium]
MSSIRKWLLPPVAFIAMCMSLDTVPCLAQDTDGGGAVTPDSADAIRASLERPPPKPPFDAVDAVGLPFEIVFFPLRVAGLTVAELVGLAVKPDPEPVQFIEALKDVGFRGGVGSIGPRSGVAARGGFVGLPPLFLQSAFSIRGSQRHRAGLRFEGREGERLEIAYTFWRNDEPYFYGGIDSAEDINRVYLWDQQTFALAGSLRLPIRPSAVLSLVGRLAYEDNRVGRGRDPGTTPIQDDTLTAGLFGVEERVKYLRGGAIIGLDLRYNEGLQTRGLYIEGSYDHFFGVDDTESDFRRVAVDLYGYLPINPRQQLALRLLTEVNRSLSGTGVPFYHLADLGSEHGGRAYHQLRFQDLAMAAMMLEWRWEIWRELHERSRIESFLFYDAGSVMPRLADFRIDDVRRSVGIGWRLITSRSGLLTNYIAFGDDGVRYRFRFSTAF